jgi:hypothetical protein
MADTRPPKVPPAVSIEVRYVGVVGGRYSLPRPDTSGGETDVYACRTVSLSPTSVVVAAPVAGNIGQVVTLLFEHIGFVKGSIARHVQGGFEVDIANEGDEREKLAAKISWLKNHRLRKAVDRREAPRRYPRVPKAYFYLEDGVEHPCFVIDISVSGAGLSAQLRPLLETAITLGDIPGTVTRRMEIGFGVTFTEAVASEVLESRVGARRTGSQ